VGLERVAFGILAFTDADCRVPADWLRVINRALSDPRIAAVGGNAYPPPDTGQFGKWTACVGHPAGGAIGFDANVERGRDGVSFVPGCNFAARKNALLAVNGFDPDFFEGGEDVDISRRLKKAGYFLDYVPELTVYHKPRSTWLSYWRWNVQVGITKFNLRRPSLGRLILEPSFPLWSAAVILGTIFLASRGHPGAALALSAGLWVLFLGVLLFLAKPFHLLIQRRKKIGVRLITVMTAVPFLVYLRQVAINIGQLKKWRRERRRKESREGKANS
jgi:GT2 family glycosyltransferase